MMSSARLSMNTCISIAIAATIIVLAALPPAIFSYLSLDRTQVADGQVWRIFTGNFVHFGWAHTLMNVAAFLICALALLNTVPTARFLSLLISCCVAVGTGVYFFNPEYENYAGLSGAIHGFIIAGLLLNKRHAYWINGIFIALTFAKIIYEHQDNYQSTQLQDLLPVAVAYDAHLYGALAGLFFGVGCLVADWITAKK